MSHCYPCVVPHSCPWIASTTAGHRRCIVAPVGALNGKQIGGGGFHKPTRNCSWKKTAVVNCAAAEAPPEALSNYPESQHEILELDIGGKKLKLETGEIGRQANAAILASDGETVIYSTTCFAAGGGSQLDFLPLTIDYQEKFSAAGKTKGGFLKRDRAVDHEMLTSRLVDRSVRPVIRKGWSQETQILEWVVSYDGENTPEALAITAASAALALSDVPIGKPVVGVRIGWTESEGPIVHPTVQELDEGKLDLILAGNSDGVVMIEGYANFLSEEDMIKAVEAGTAAVSSASEQIAEWAKRIGKKKAVEMLNAEPEDINDKLEDFCRPEVEDVFKQWEKAKRSEQLKQLWERIKSQFSLKEGEDLEDNQGQYEEFHLKKAFKKLQSKVVRERILRDNIRIDGRTSTSIRPIYSRANVLARTHGSALFTRGCTQALCVTTLGGRRAAQRVNTIKAEDDLRFYLQYFFPPSATGEVKRYGGMPGRRELGHGQLASRSLECIVPDVDDFPYTIRVESTITESDGSSSMASVCGGCLAMMDAGVPIKNPVAGIAMGLVLSDEPDKFVVLSDILGTEDALGEMDFKVAGNGDGITGFQMDVKVENISTDVIAQALVQAKEGRIHILEQMTKCSPPPRETLSDYAPALLQLQVDPEETGYIIGRRGKTIREITELTEVDSIDVDEEGTVIIESSSMEKGLQAAEIIERLTKKREMGEIFRERKVVKILPFGAFVNLMPGVDGLLHIGELGEGHIEKVEDVINLGDIVDVQILSASADRIRLSTEILEDKEAVEKRREESKQAMAALRAGSKKSMNGKGGGKNHRSKRGGGGKESSTEAVKEEPPVVLKARPSKLKSGE